MYRSEFKFFVVVPCLAPMSSSGFSSRFASSAPRERVVSLGPRPPASSSRPPSGDTATPFAGFGVGVGSSTLRVPVTTFTGLAPGLSDTGGDNLDGVVMDRPSASTGARDASHGLEGVDSPRGGAFAPRSPPAFFSRDRGGFAGIASSSQASSGAGLNGDKSDVGWAGGVARGSVASDADMGPPYSSSERLVSAWAKAEQESDAWYFKSRGLSSESDIGSMLVEGLEDTKPSGRVSSKRSAVASVAESLSSSRFPGGFPSKPESLEGNIHGENSSASSNHRVALLCINVKEHELCGSAVGASGKFCILPKHSCKTKSHQKKGSSFLESLKSKGLGRTIFITAPMGKAQQGKDDAPIQAFKDPFLDAEVLSPTKTEDLLGSEKQPVLMWTSLFSLMKSEAQSSFESAKKNMGVTLEAIGEAGETDPDSWSVADEEEALEFATVSTLKNKAVSAAFTPAKGLRLEDVEIPSPIEPLVTILSES